MNLTHIRHSKRDSGNKHINDTGLSIAHQVGKILGDFDLVITSVSSRAIETCIALGYTIDITIDFSSSTEGINKPLKQLADRTPFIVYQQEYQDKSIIFDFGNNCKKLILDAITNSPKQKKNNILLVSHGGVIEASTVAFSPKTDFESFGPGVDYCEGVLIELTDGLEWVQGKPFRHSFN